MKYKCKSMKYKCKKKNPEKTENEFLTLDLNWPFCDHLFRTNELSAFYSHFSLHRSINIDTRATVKWSAHRWQPGSSLFSHWWPQSIHERVHSIPLRLQLHKTQDIHYGHCPASPQIISIQAVSNGLLSERSFKPLSNLKGIRANRDKSHSVL